MSALDTGHISDAGMVIVGYEIGDFVPVDYELTRQMFHLVRNFPFQVVASHSCYSSSPMEKVADLIVHMVSSFVRLRLRMHYGTYAFMIQSRSVDIVGLFLTIILCRTRISSGMSLSTANDGNSCGVLAYYYGWNAAYGKPSPVVADSYLARRKGGICFSFCRSRF